MHICKLAKKNFSFRIPGKCATVLKGLKDIGINLNRLILFIQAGLIGYVFFTSGTGLGLSGWIFCRRCQDFLYGYLGWFTLTMSTMVMVDLTYRSEAHTSLKERLVKQRFLAESSSLEKPS